MANFIQDPPSAGLADLLIRPDSAGLSNAARIIKSGGIVAFPTETVYGLGANALNADAVKSIFVAKGRPLTDPLIVHIAEASDAWRLIDVNEEEKFIFQLLADQFWPGPLTIIVKASSLIPSLVTAETGFVGIRCPKHPLAKQLLLASGVPIAAPSANRFGHVSPTKAAHVLLDLGGKGVHVLNGEYEYVDSGGTRVGYDEPANRVEKSAAPPRHNNCEYGIESTVLKVDKSSRELVIFRHGAVTQVQFEHLLNRQRRKNIETGAFLSGWSVVSKVRVVSMHPESHGPMARETVSCGTGASIEDMGAKSPHISDLCKIALVRETDSHGKRGEGSREGNSGQEGQQAPGQAITHYAPDVPCMIVCAVHIAEDLAPAPATTMSSSVDKEASLTINKVELRDGCVVLDFGHSCLSVLEPLVLAYRNLSLSGCASEAAHDLFDGLRWAEAVPGARRVLVAEIVPPSAEQQQQPSAEQSSISRVNYEVGPGAGGGGGRSPQVVIGDGLDLSVGLADRIFRAASGNLVSIRID